MKKPVIGITMYGRDEKNNFPLPGEYVDSVRRAGGLPILLAAGETDLSGILALMDGLILAGGGDVDPAAYGSDGHSQCYMVDGERDEYELKMVQAVIEDKMPTLGICRGAQILNVALGGTLIEHLPDVVDNGILHRVPPREPTMHSVTIMEGSLLSSVMGVSHGEISSWHHQAIDKVAEELSVVSHAPDGTIEAVEMKDHPFMVAVQWHPELTSANDAAQQRLFDGLVSAATQSLKR